MKCPICREDDLYEDNDTEDYVCDECGVIQNSFALDNYDDEPDEEDNELNDEYEGDNDDWKDDYMDDSIFGL